MKLNKIQSLIIKTAALVALCVANVYADTQDVTAAKPNIIFIFADDLGWGDISKHGHPDIRTPNIDRLADEGSEFYQFSVSNPVCSPSRAAVMTGQYPARNNVHRHFAGLDHHKNFAMADWLDPRAVNMPTVMKAAGYKTAHFGKWHLGRNGAPEPISYGYDETAVFNGDGPQTTFVKLYDDAIDFMTRHKDEPFFINLWIHETHLPHDPSQESLDKYKHLSEQDRVYAAVVDGADQRIGKVLDALDELNLTDNTLMVFSSDNGPEHTGTVEQKFHGNRKEKNRSDRTAYGKYYSTGSSGGLRGGKRDTYEGGLRVPFIVRWPGQIPAGRTDTESIVSAVDLLPTFAEIAGATLPEGYVSDGQSVLSLLKGGTIERNKPMFWEWRYGNKESKKDGKKPMLAVREGPWKLFVHQATNSVEPYVELYNVMHDRNETMNIADDHPDLVNSMKALALEWKATLPTEPAAHTLSPDRALPGTDEERKAARKENRKNKNKNKKSR
tara:strand:+ start:4544 stop:6040 length:1497 start_codon:yes stop_codon:yes gene_type:complete